MTVSRDSVHAEESRRAQGSGEHLRLFVALELPPALREPLAGWAASVAGATPGLRPVPADSLHVTLCFIGERPAAQVGEIAEACTVATGSPAPEVELTDVLWLPRRRPRALAVGLRERTGALASLQGALAARLASDGFIAPERRPFLAHVTVARVRGSIRPQELPPPRPEPGRFAAVSVTLLRSSLGCGPARYEALAALPLASG